MKLRILKILSVIFAAACAVHLQTSIFAQDDDVQDSKAKKGVHAADNIDIRRSVIEVSTDTGGATAFFALIKGKYFVVTNFHVVSSKDELAFTTIDGHVLSLPDGGYIGDARDIYVFPLNSLPEGAVALSVSENAVEDAKAGDEIMICGNPLAGGVLVNTHGKLSAFGPGILELDCAVFQGNSGSPVYHKKSGKVIGVVSHIQYVQNNPLASNARKKSGSPIKLATRYFGVRIDTVKNWALFPLSEIKIQLAEIAALKNKLEVVQGFMDSSYKKIKVPSNYPEFEKIAYKYGNLIDRRLIIKRDSRSAGNTLDKIAEREMCEDMARLLGHETTKIKARKFNDRLKSEVSSIQDSFELMREIFTARSKAEILK